MRGHRRNGSGAWAFLATATGTPRVAPGPAGRRDSALRTRVLHPQHPGRGHFLSLLGNAGELSRVRASPKGAGRPASRDCPPAGGGGPGSSLQPCPSPSRPGGGRSVSGAATVRRSPGFPVQSRAGHRARSPHDSASADPRRCAPQAGSGGGAGEGTVDPAVRSRPPAGEEERSASASRRGPTTAPWSPPGRRLPTGSRSAPTRSGAPCG